MYIYINIGESLSARSGTQLMKDFLVSQGPTHGIVNGGNAGRCSRHKTCEKSVKEKAEFIPQV